MPASSLRQSPVTGGAALRDAAAEMARRLELTADDPIVTKSSVLSFLNRRADDLDKGLPSGWATVDLGALDTVLLDSLGPRGRDDIFGAWARAAEPPTPTRSQTAGLPVGPRIDVVVDRDPDDGTEVHVYMDGTPARAVVHTIDPGRSGADHEWWSSVTALGPEVPRAVRDKVTEYADGYHDPEKCGRSCP
ncbi:hypothetical protein ABT093_40765 [Kitasatospora sp. NPDC002551]|uniref:hypothetical protein n=1 Tax=Kitasatospora sp. NPDC002551 TaxID=3154539 RepID=UPI00332808FD